MNIALTEPTDLERATADQVRTACQKVLLEHPDRGREAAATLRLRPMDVDRLLRRDDWTLAGALRVAKALGLKIRLDVQVG